MRIGIDARTLYAPALKGIGVYLRNLLEQFAVIDPANEYLLYYDSRQKITRHYEPVSPRMKERPIQINAGDTLYFWEQFCLPAALKRDKVDLLHSPANTSCFGFEGPKVVTVHDVTMQLRKDKTRVDAFYYDWIQPRVLRGVSSVITVSEYSRGGIMNTLKVPADKVRVIHQGVNPAYHKVMDLSLVEAVKSRYAILGDYIFNAGGESSFKNVERLIEAYALLVHRDRVSEKLVITGIRNKDILHQHLETIARLDLAGRVHILGFIPIEDLITLYSGASLFVYPSLMEGFGFPPLEAMACGTPAVVSNAASIPEVAGDAALLFDPVNTEDIAAKCYQVLSSPDLQRDLVRRGLEHIKKFRWDTVARQTLEVYGRVKR